MRIAVASDGLSIAQHFSQCLNFNYYTTCSYQIIESQNIPAQGVTAEEYARLMDHIGVDALIVNHISPTARATFLEHGIEVVESQEGLAIEAAERYIDERAAELVANIPQDDDE